MKQRNIISASAFIMAALCLCAGILIGRHFNSRPEPRETMSHSARSDRPQLESRSLRERVANPVVAALEQLRQLTADRHGKNLDVAEAVLLIRQLNLMECKAAWQIIRNFEGTERSALMGALAARWATLDPRDAIAEAMRNRSDPAWRERLGSAA